MYYRFGPLFRMKRFRRAHREHRERVIRERNKERQKILKELYPKRLIENGNIFLDNFNSINKLTMVGHQILEKSQSPFQKVIKKLYVVSFQDFFCLPVNIREKYLKLVSKNTDEPNQSQYQFQVKIFTFKKSFEFEYPSHMQIILNGNNIIESHHNIKNHIIENQITVFHYNPIDVSQYINNNNRFTMHALGTIGVLMLQIVKINNFISPLNLINL
ncbi:hypothetical protein ACTFIU_006433 [Dictyostelium citrinum]